MSNDNKMIAKLGRVCRRLYGESVLGIGYLMASGGGLGAIGVWVYQAYGWLRFGEWTPFPLFRALPYSFISGLDRGLAEWQGLAKIVTWFLSLNVGVWLLPLFLVGIAVASKGIEIRDRADEDANLAARSSLGYDK